MRIQLDHMGMSGLRLCWEGHRICVDPPQRGPEPAVVTWNEAERLTGLTGREVAGHPRLLSWLQCAGTALRPGTSVTLAGIRVHAASFAPIPYAVPLEAWRKTCIAVSRPLFAARRLRHTLGVPRVPPVALRLEASGLTIALCQQSLHRFVAPAAADRLRRFFAGADVALASPDFEDEAACAELLGSLEVRHTVLVDSIGPVRRMLGLPTRPLATAQHLAPAHTRLLEEGARLTIAL